MNDHFSWRWLDVLAHDSMVDARMALYEVAETLDNRAELLSDCDRDIGTRVLAES